MIRRFDIRGDDGSVYLTRWTLLSLFGYRLRLHKMHRPDADRCLHDHPWGFVSLVLWGGYVEEIERVRLDSRMVTYRTERRVQWNRPGTLLFRRATHRHRIAALPNATAWTLLVTGPDVREWGFWSGTTWTDWRTFLAHPFSRRVAWCEDRAPLPETPEREA